MMPCNIFDVNPTADLMIQARKNRLLSLIKQLLENMRGGNSLFIIITSKENMQASKKAENKHSNRQ